MAIGGEGDGATLRREADIVVSAADGQRQAAPVAHSPTVATGCLYGHQPLAIFSAPEELVAQLTSL